MTVDYDNIKKEFKYVGGCYENGNTYKHVLAKQDSIYKFDAIEIEVRNAKDPVIKAAELSNYTYSFGLGWVNK